LNLASISYATAALAFTLVVMLAPAARHSESRGRVLATAAGATALWAALLATASAGVDVKPWMLQLAGALRYAAWFQLLRVLTGRSLPRWLVILAFVLCGLTAVGGLLPSEASRVLAERANLLLAFVGLMLIEQLMRSTDLSGGRSFKAVAIAIGGQFAYDLYLYSQAELFGGLNESGWSVRGFVLAALVPILVYGTRQHGERDRRIFVSRHVVFYSSAVLAIGLYLIAMAIGGYYVRLVSGDWGVMLHAVFIAGAAGVLASIVMRGGAWRRLKIFIATHFYQNKFDYRIEWLRFISTLSSTPGGELGQKAIQAVAQIFSSSGGLLILRESGTGVFRLYSAWPVALSGQFTVPEMLGDHSLIRFLAERQWVVDLEECRQSSGTYGQLELPAWLAEDDQLRILVPLLTLNRLDGFLCLTSPPAPFSMNFEDHDLLKTLGRHVAVHIGQHAADQRLAEGRQFDTYNKLAAFVMHDLKNSVAQLQLLVGNATRHRNNPAFIDDAIDTIANATERMTRLIEQLRSPDAAGRQREIDLSEVLRAAIERTGSRLPRPQLLQAPEVARISADSERLGAILDHIIRNAQDATGVQGSIMVTLRVEAERALLTVEDTGSGMDMKFVQDRLFRPFDSTKGSKGMGIGAYQAREYVRYIGGDVEVRSAPGQGTRFSIMLPLCQT
jgi:putative PEP-CTERM system histidine kinase